MHEPEEKPTQGLSEVQDQGREKSEMREGQGSRPGPGGADRVLCTEKAQTTTDEEISMVSPL